MPGIPEPGPGSLFRPPALYRRADDPINAHFQQAVFFCLDGGQVLLNAPKVLGVVVLVRDGLEKSFRNGVNSPLVTTILDKIVVKKGSTREVLRLDIFPKFGGPWKAGSWV